ncbi:DUF6864 domain-containing function [Paenibacillus taichungensis]
MKKTTILSGPTEIISTGTVISFEENPTNFIIELEGNFKLKVNMMFASDSTETYKTQVEFDEEKTELNLTFHNFNSPLGVGNKLPMSLGSFANKNIHLNYRVYSLENVSSKMIHYTFYRSIKEGE